MSLLYKTFAPELPELAGLVASLSSDCASVSGAFGLGFQKAFWRTSDGQRHIVYNRGSLNGAGNSLQLATSSDGINWVNVLTFAATDANSNADFIQQNATTWWGTYGDNAGAVHVVKLVYAGAGAWSIATGPETIPLSAGVTGKNPSIVIDGNATIWVSLLANDATNGDYMLIYHRVGAASYNNTTIKFGSPDISAAPQRSMRLMQVPGGIFAIYTVHGTLNYRRHNLTNPIATWSAEVTLFNDPLQVDFYQSEFNVAFDSLRNLHLAYSGEGRLLNFRWDAASTTWTNQFVTLAICSAMPQAVVSDSDLVWLVTQDQYTNALAFLSSDGGNTYEQAATYSHALGTATVTYPNPRPRALAPLGSTFPPLLLEYTDVTAGLERALAYAA